MNRLIAFATSFVRGLERLGPSELRHYGLIAVGIGICMFAALLTFRLLGPVPVGLALMLASLAVASITLGAIAFERAGYLD